MTAAIVREERLFVKTQRLFVKILRREHSFVSVETDAAQL
jgi:hypothetical protein